MIAISSCDHTATRCELEQEQPAHGGGAGSQDAVVSDQVDPWQRPLGGELSYRFRRGQPMTPRLPCALLCALVVACGVEIWRYYAG